VNVATKVMANVPTKHIGIHVSGAIWHYSNSERKVVQQTLTSFPITTLRRTTRCSTGRCHELWLKDRIVRKASPASAGEWLIEEG
jgi:hypothetical protein